MLLSDIVEAYMASLPAGIVLGEEEITRNLKKAVRFYCGYAVLKSAPPEDEDEDDTTPPFHTDIDATDSIDSDQDFDLSPSEWSIIRPLFDLYVERENATHLEASRSLGVDVFGRTVSEVTQDINLKEQEMPRAAFMEPFFSV
jgi:hypothetical protein